MILKKENSFDISHFNNFHLFHYKNIKLDHITLSLHKQDFEMKKDNSSRVFRTYCTLGSWHSASDSFISVFS